MKNNLLKSIRCLNTASKLFAEKDTKAYQWAQNHLGKAYLKLAIMFINEEKMNKTCMYLKKAQKLLSEDEPAKDLVRSLIQQLECE